MILMSINFLPNNAKQNCHHLIHVWDPKTGVCPFLPDTIKSTTKGFCHIFFQLQMLWYSTTAEFISKCKEGHDPKRAPTVSVCKVKSTTKVLSHFLPASGGNIARQLNSSPSAKKDTTPKELQQYLYAKWRAQPKFCHICFQLPGAVQWQYSWIHLQVQRRTRPQRAPTVSVCKVKSTTKVLSHFLPATGGNIALQLNSSPSAKKDTTPKS